jgi:hypothetical protein
MNRSRVCSPEACAGAAGCCAFDQRDRDAKTGHHDRLAVKRTQVASARPARRRRSRATGWFAAHVARELGVAGGAATDL